MGKAKDWAKTLFHTQKGRLLEGEKDGSKIEFNVNQFRSAINKANGLYRPNRYLFKIKTPPRVVSSQLDPQNTINEMVFFCDNINIPGLSLIPADYKRLGIGTFDRRATSAIPAEISASFMLDGMGRNLNFFQDWTSSIAYMGDLLNDPATHAKPSGTMNGRVITSYGELAYHKDYCVDVEIQTFSSAVADPDNPKEPMKISTLHAYEVWPSQLGDVTLGWAQNDEVGRVTLNFQLRRWSVENHVDPSFDPMESVLNPDDFSFFEKMLRIGQGAMALKNAYKKPRNVGDVLNLVSGAQTFKQSFGGRKSPFGG